ncbi:MAG TPA: hypothetical protein VFX59_03155, partial [Polyangiales bacterium]|nr:hypothetical protein [Polyangiales bacterium]
MRRQSLVGPGFGELRTTKQRAQQESDGFPVFRRLADILAGVPVEDELSPGTMIDREAVGRYVCSVLSCWAYADLDDVAVIMTRLGLEKCRCRSIEIANNGALIRSTAYLVQSECGRVALLVYRGTDPFDISTWAVSGDLNPATVRIVQAGSRKPKGATTDSTALVPAPAERWATTSARKARSRVLEDARKALVFVRQTAETGGGLLGVGGDVVKGVL